MTGPPAIEAALVRVAQRGDPIAMAGLMDILARMWAGCAVRSRCKTARTPRKRR